MSSQLNEVGDKSKFIRAAILDKLTLKRKVEVLRDASAKHKRSRRKGN